MDQVSERKRRDWQWFWEEWVRPILLVVAIILPLRSSIADWYDVPTGSMIPTIIEGDRVFVNKLAYDLKVPFTTRHIAVWDHPSRGDIVVFKSPADGIRLVKRVIGLPGDTLTMLGNRLFVNGESVEYATLTERVSGQLPAIGRTRYAFAKEKLPGKSHAVMFTPNMPSMQNFGPVVIPEGQYFVMGDNRDNSNDSRFIGSINREAITGRAMGIALSLDHKHWFAPRFQRFFRKF